MNGHDGTALAFDAWSKSTHHARSAETVATILDEVETPAHLPNEIAIHGDPPAARVTTEVFEDLDT